MYIHSLKRILLYTTDNLKYGSSTFCGFCFQDTRAAGPEQPCGDHMAGYKVTTVNKTGGSDEQSSSNF